MRTAVLVAMILLMGYFLWDQSFGWKFLSSDFANYYASAKMISRGEDLDSLYDNLWFKTKAEQMGVEQAQKFAPFPPITAFIALPLTGFTQLQAQRAITVINLICLGISISLIRLITGWRYSSSALFILLTGWGLINNFLFGQLYILVLMVTLISHLLILREKEWGAGVLNAMTATVKYFSIVYLPAYWLCGKKKYTLSVIMAVVLIALLQLWFFGEKVMTDYVMSSLLPHLDGRLNGQGVFHFRFQSWESLLSFLFVFDPVYNMEPVVHAPFLKLILKYAIALGILVWTIYAANRIKHLPAKWRLCAYVSICGITAFTLLPASATYHFIMLAFPTMAILMIDDLRRSERWAIIGLYAFIGLISYDLFEYIGRLWFVMLGFPRLWATLALWIVVTLSIRRMSATPQPTG